MPIIERIASQAAEISEWRRDLHANPELLYDVYRTASFVADKLKQFGCDEIATGIGRSGVVGVIEGNACNSGKTIGLRADMDALPINEVKSLPYKSRIPGVMHACGHDGHTAMLLGAAKYLSETRNFDGRVVLVFQPAEEGGAGAKAMIEDGLITRFGLQEVFGMHNRPGLAVGDFAIRRGAVHAAMDEFSIAIEGKGGHAAKPHLCIDPILAGAQIVNSIQSIVSRNSDPLEAAVVSVTRFQSGEAFNVIPQTASLGGTVRTFDPQIRDHIEARIVEIVEAVGRTYGASATVFYDRKYPLVWNHEEQTDFSAAVAWDIVEAHHVDVSIPPDMGAEDFAFMLEQAPGAIIFVGNGPSAEHHNPAYDFNDEIIPYGTSYWIRLVELAMPV